jgi:hypothetical protein
MSSENNKMENGKQKIEIGKWRRERTEEKSTGKSACATNPGPSKLRVNRNGRATGGVARIGNCFAMA